MLENLEDLEDGSCLLIVQGHGEEKTFKDYKNPIQCLDCVVEYFEQYQDSEGRDTKNYTIDEVMEWINSSFTRIELFVYDKTIARYRRLSRRELREHFMRVLQKEINNSKSNQSASNGRTHNHVDDSDAESEVWD